MAVTLLNLTEQIQNDYGVLGDPLFQKTRLTLMINQAQKDVQAKLGALGMNRFEAVKDISSALTTGSFNGKNNVKTVAINTVNLPNFLETPDSIRFVECNDGTNYGDTLKPVTPIEFKNKTENLYLAPTVSEPLAMRLDNLLYLSPSTITAATVHYYSYPADLVKDDDVTAIPDEFTKYIVKMVGVEIEGIQGKLQDKAAAISDIENAIAESFQRFKDKQSERAQKLPQDNLKLA